MEYYETFLKIDLDAIRDNFRAVAEKAGVPVMAVVKADAYGHGAVQVARLLEQDCTFFGVASVAEALELRQAGLTKPILILGHTPVSAFPLVVRHGIRPTIFRYEDAQELSRVAQEQGLVAPFHFAVDTGMGRIGFPVTQAAAEVCAEIARLPGLEAEGMFSHFATADCADLTRSYEQKRRFDAFDEMLRQLGVAVKIRHLSNSAGVMNFNSHYEMVRSGIVTYGLYPSEEVDPEKLRLRPAMSWHSRISYVKTLDAGCQISYGGTYTTTKPTRVATVPVGYGDGYRRNLSNRFWVLIRGCRAPILGRICMDQMMVDVTDIPDVKDGDPVVLMGADGSETITVEEIAAAADSFNYEFVCGIARRCPRLYYQGGQCIQEKDDLLDK